MINAAPSVATRSPAARPEVTTTVAPSSGSTVTTRGSNRSGAVLTHTMLWLAGFFIKDAAGTGTPATWRRLCTTTATGWPTASWLSAAPSARKASGSACSRNTREAPTKMSGTFCPPTTREAPATSAASAASNAKASMRKRSGSITSNSNSRASTTWPATALAEAMTPDTGATSVSRADSPAVSAA